MEACAGESDVPRLQTGEPMPPDQSVERLRGCTGGQRDDDFVADEAPFTRGRETARSRPIGGRRYGCAGACAQVLADSERPSFNRAHGIPVEDVASPAVEWVEHIPSVWSWQAAVENRSARRQRIGHPRRVSQIGNCGIARNCGAAKPADPSTPDPRASANSSAAAQAPKLCLCASNGRRKQEQRGSRMPNDILAHGIPPQRRIYASRSK